MMFFARAVVTGFALSLGAALYKKVERKLGLAEPDAKKDSGEEIRRQEGGTDPELREQTT